MNKLSLAWLFSAALVIGCGGNVVKSSGGSGGTGGAGTGGGDGGTATTTSITSTTSSTDTIVPPQCAVNTNQTAPYAVTFQFTVGTGQVAFLAEDCYTQFQVTSCASAYVNPVGMHGECTIDCSDMTGCIDCGACPSGAILVSQGAPHNVDWDGVQYFFDTNSSGCSCHTTTNALAAKYRVEVPVYVTEQDALNHTNGVVLTHEFDLPAPNGIVTVPVGLQPN